jgi:GMP synthase PP-ATPase subunit
VTPDWDDLIKAVLGDGDLPKGTVTTFQSSVSSVSIATSEDSKMTTVKVDGKVLTGAEAKKVQNEIADMLATSMGATDKTKEALEKMKASAEKMASKLKKRGKK